MRAVPGLESRTFIREQAGAIRGNECDSIFSQKDGVDTYVIRRSQQTLPCFLVYYH